MTSVFVSICVSVCICVCAYNVDTRVSTLVCPPLLLPINLLRQAIIEPGAHQLASVPGPYFSDPPASTFLD